ncbi:MAG: hypothetical protein M9955_23345 [Rhizobiaceae bacterium]|nr:hypothetical protein [Rhizobiaceae bacterium]
MQKTPCSSCDPADEGPGTRRLREKTSFSGRPGQRPVQIVLDAREDDEGRALLAISALHLCARCLPDVIVRALCPTGAVVSVALEAFEWDTGVEVQVFGIEDAAAAFEGADLYVSVSLDSVHRGWFEQAQRAGIQAVVATQFPETVDRQFLTMPVRVAHDTRLLAERVLECLENRR